MIWVPITNATGDIKDDLISNFLEDLSTKNKNIIIDMKQYEIFKLLRKIVHKIFVLFCIISALIVIIFTFMNSLT